MALIIDNGTHLSINAHWTNGHKINNTFFYQRVENSPQQAAQDVLDNWQDHIVPLMLNNYQLDSISYVDLNSADGITGTIPYDPAKPHNGPDDAGGPPPHTCRLIHKNCDARRGGRNGRLYIGPCGNSQIDEDGTVSTAMRALVDTNFAAFLAGTSDAAGYIAVLHTGAGAPPSSSKVLSYNCDAKVAVQRRRIGR